MRKLLLIAAFATPVALSSCKKAIQNAEKNYVLSLMTQGHWNVSMYKDTTTDVTGEFTHYAFQFYDNGKVDAIDTTTSGIITTSGTWTADISTYSITSSFPLNACDTLLRLNYKWTITDSGTNYVKSKTITPAGTNLLNLIKY